MIGKYYSKCHNSVSRLKLMLWWLLLPYKTIYEKCSTYDLMLHMLDKNPDYMQYKEILDVTNYRSSEISIGTSKDRYDS